MESFNVEHFRKLNGNVDYAVTLRRKCATNTDTCRFHLECTGKKWLVWITCPWHYVYYEGNQTVMWPAENALSDNAARWSKWLLVDFVFQAYKIRFNIRSNTTILCYFSRNFSTIDGSIYVFINNKRCFCIVYMIHILNIQSNTLHAKN